jgi:hypothetical protein
MSLNTLNFTDARIISKEYQNHPVESWAHLFKEVSKTLEKDDEEFEPTKEEKKTEDYSTQVTQEAGTIKIIQPA